MNRIIVSGKLVWQRPNSERRSRKRIRNRQSTDEAFRYYAQTHPDEHLTEPHFSNYYKPSKEQRSGEMLFTGVTVAGLAYGISRLV